MAKVKNSFNNLVTKVEFRKKISQLEGKMGDMEKGLRAEMGDMGTRLGGEIGRLEMRLREDMGEMKKELTDKFLTGWDKVMKELHTIRQEQAAHFLAHDRINEELAALAYGKQVD